MRVATGEAGAGRLYRAWVRDGSDVCVADGVDGHFHAQRGGGVWYGDAVRAAVCGAPAMGPVGVGTALVDGVTEATAK